MGALSYPQTCQESQFLDAMKIETKTSRWIEEGFISSEQAEQILHFEQTTGQTRWSHISLYSFVILGSCVVSIGIVSLIAANWEYIPEALKLAVAFVALAGLGMGIYWAQDRDRNIVFDVLSTIFVLWSLATIGLIAQVFHTGGEPHQALLYWLIIVLPLSYLGKKTFLSSLWVVGLLTTFFVWSLNADSWWARNFLVDGGYIDDDNVFPLFMITAMWTICAASACTHIPKLARFSANLSFWGMMAIVVAVGVGDVYCSAQEQVSANALFPAYLLLPLAVAAVVMRTDVSRREKALLGALLCLSLAIYLPSLAFSSANRYSGDFDEWYKLLGATYFIVSTVLLALYFAVRKRYWLFNAMTIIVGIRFLIIYFQVFQDLAYTGIGLVVSGLVIIGLAVAWYKYRPRLEIWVKGFVE